MQTRRLGRTGHESTVAILGGAAFARATPDEAAAGFADAVARGVNHLDIAPRYGAAETVVGPLVPAVRDRLFIGEKTTRRNANGVRAQLEETLTLLGCDSVDLYQLHGVTDVDELNRRRDAAAAIMKARDEGLCRFVGITGHNMTAPGAFAEALRRYDLDTVMFPVYPRVWADAAYRRDAERLLDLCTERDLGVMAIKAAAWRPWGDREHTQTTWYEHQPTPERIAMGVRFALSTPGVHAFCSPGDLAATRQALDAAETFVPMDRDEWAATIAAAEGDVIFPIPA
jgi:aryl-alcohol dehydrogenase-like predicted oxidoreductase